MKKSLSSRIFRHLGRAALPALVLIVLAVPMVSFGQQKVTEPHIGGYSPVSYFTENRAERGRREFAVQHLGRTYWLTSEEQVALFKQDPDKYRPQYDVCPYSLALGKKLPLDPENFRIIGGLLLLFHKSEESDGLRAFEQSGISEEELLRRADASYTLFRFD